MHTNRIAIAMLLMLVPFAAAAQQTRPRSITGAPPQPNNSRAAIGTASRDGCFNVPGEAHDSASCQKIGPDAPGATAGQNRTDLSGRPTGAAENAARNARIFAEQPRR